MKREVLDYAPPRIRSRRRVVLWLAAAAALLVLVAARLTVRRWKATRPARVAAARVEVVRLQAAVEAFGQDVGRYPTTNEGLEALIGKPEGATGWNGPYFDRGIARDPWNNRRLHSRDMWGNPFDYTCWDGKYRIVSAGPDRRAWTADDISASGPAALAPP